MALSALLFASTFVFSQAAPPQIKAPTITATPESVTSEPDADTQQKEKEKAKPGAAEEKKAAQKPAAKGAKGAEKSAAKTEEKKDDKKDDKKDPFSSGTFSGLKLRNIGPAFTSG